MCEGPMQIAVSSFNGISAPNKYIGKIDRYHGILGGETNFTTYKLIEGKVVYTGEGDYHYGLFQDYEGNRIGSEAPGIIDTSYSSDELDKQKYNELGQREMIFFIRSLIIQSIKMICCYVPIGEKLVNLEELIFENKEKLTENSTASNSHRQEMYDLFYQPLSNYGLKFVKKCT